jgi:hypothetical protein
MMGNRTRVHIECPYIIKKFPEDVTTKDEELGTDHRRGVIVTSGGPRTIDHDAGPLSRYWSARISNQLGVNPHIKRSDVPRLSR